MSKRFRFILILGILGLCFVFLLPSVRWHFWTPREDQVRALVSREQIRAYSTGMAHAHADNLIYLGRTGGNVPEELAFLIPEARGLLSRDARPSTWDARAVLNAFGSRPAVVEAIQAHYRETIFGLRSLHRNAVQLGLDLSGGLSIVLQADLDALQYRLGRSLNDADREDAIERALDVLNSRIDRFGLTEPVIRRQGADQIYVEIPGTADPERINDIIMGRGSLTFHIVDEEATRIFNAFYNARPGDTFDLRGELNPAIAIPDDVVIRGVFGRDQYGLDEHLLNALGNPNFVAIRREIGLDGNHIRSAEVNRNPDPMERNPVVTFLLDSEGGEIFHRLTSANVNRPMAIVLEDRVRSVATIRGPIREAVSLEGFAADEARNIALMLRTAALPVELEVVNQQSIGASLGEDTIRRGLNALLLGIALVLTFMLLYYKGAGINAVVAQLLNFYIMFSVLSAFSFTLTLPAIAGFILTIGMATDASVIIFERMKEEIRLGKSRKAAIELGFGKAFWAIMDSNITTFIAALFLSQLGTGPIRGFAVALAIGVFSSVFTALFVSRLMFDFGTDVMKRKTLSISWFPIRSEAQAIKGVS